MIQISEKIFCEEFLYTSVTENKLLPNPYYDYPFLVIENFLNPLEVESIAKVVQKESDEQEAKIKTKILESVVVPSIDKEIRKTTLSTVPPLYAEIYQKRFFEHQQSIENFFAMGLTHGTPLQVLVYREGDFYIKHADDSSEIIDKKGNIVE